MGKVAAGFFSFTEITDPAEHRSYNEWHQLDHLPEQYPLTGIVAGQRWVCSPGCRAARAAGSELLDPIDYMTLYLMAEPLEHTLADFRALAGRLRQADRFFAHRRSLLSGPFAVDRYLAAPRVRVSPEAVPHRPNLGVYVLVEEWPDPSAPSEDLEPHFDVAGVVGVWRFTTIDGPQARYWVKGSHRITVWYLDADPVAVAAELGPAVTREHKDVGGPILLAGPFETVVPWAWDWFDRPADATRR